MQVAGSGSFVGKMRERARAETVHVEMLELLYRPKAFNPFLTPLKVGP